MQKRGYSSSIPNVMEANFLIKEVIDIMSSTNIPCGLVEGLLIYDDAFFNRTGLERVGVVGAEPGLLLD